MNGGLSFIVSGLCGLLAGGINMNKRISNAKRFNSIQDFMPKLTDHERYDLLPVVQREYKKIKFQGVNAARHGTEDRKFRHYTSYKAIQSAWLCDHCEALGIEYTLPVVQYATGQAEEIAMNNRMLMFRYRGY